MRTLFFQINNGPLKEFAQMQENEPFTIVIENLPSEKEISEMKKNGVKYSLLHFKDDEGNEFRITC